MEFAFNEINYLAVLIAAVAAMFSGALWYSPLLFGNAWMKMSGITKKQIEESKKKGMALSYIGNFVTQLVTAYILAHFIIFVDAGSYGESLLTAFWIWIGFMATYNLNMVLWDGKPFALYLINSVHSLVGMLIMSAILFAF